MATYKGIQGYTVQKLSDDPTASEASGQLWYNSGTGKFKVGTEAAGAWSSATAMNTGRDEMASGGTQSAAWGAGGEPPNTAKTEIYDGSTWTEVADLIDGTRMQLEGFGSTTAAIVCGGNPPSAGGNFTESWDGTSWSEENNMNTPRYNFGSAIGSPSTAGLVYGGITSPGHGNDTANTENWNGTTWTEVNDMLTTRAGATGLGIQTAAMAVAGVTDSVTVQVAVCETYDGSSWSETGDVNQARYNVGTAGTTTLGLCFAGIYPSASPVFNQLTEKFDGTSWTEVADLATARSKGPGCAGSEVAGICYGGSAPGGATTATEEWNDPVYTIKTVTVS